jgi:hypothetical protein
MRPEPQLVLGSDLAVRAGDDELARYVMEAAAPFESPRPYWHPIRSRGGVVVSESRPPDHSWHWGLSIAVSNVHVEDFHEEVNVWGGVTWVPERGYEQLANNGSQRHNGWESVSAPRATQRLSWCTAHGRVFLAEERTVGVSASAHAAGWQLETTSTWTNVTGRPIRFGSPTTAGRPNAGYGGFFLRGSAALLGAQVALDGEQLTAAEAQGRAGSTMVLTSARAPVAVAMSAAPSNPVTPTCWFVRTDPVAMLCAAPFFDTEWALPADTSATWSWQLRVTDV